MKEENYRLIELAQKGDKEALEAIRLLTHLPHVPYMEYVAEIKKNPIAKAVKLADLRHNSDMSRLDTVTEYDEIRAEKYLAAIELLNSPD